jgi:hypothetical protein
MEIAELGVEERVPLSFRFFIKEAADGEARGRSPSAGGDGLLLGVQGLHGHGTRTRQNSQASDGGIVVASDTDIQELNSIAANQHYNPNSTYYDLHANNRQRIFTGSDEYSYLADPVDDNFHTLRSTLMWDANGATILHQCFQHRKYDLVKWFITNYPVFSLEPYLLYKQVDGKEVKLPYGGQNILHMAVLAKNHVMAKWILDYYSRLSDAMLHKLLTERVYTQSGYFSKKGEHYCGETPLQFAVCTDDVDMVDLIMSFVSLLEPINLKMGKSPRNLLFFPDCNGNNVVHLCVKGSLHKMYEHLKYFAVEMLQQELMIAVHKSMLEGSPTCGEIAVNYDVYFGEHADYKFRGHVRNMGTIKLPEDDTKKLFLLAQVYKHFENKKDVTETVVTEFLSGLPNRFGLTAQDVTSHNPPQSIISELKRRFSRWLYGIEAGFKSGEINRMFNNFFMHGLNEEGHSPVTLAACRGQALMLRHFLKENVSHKDRGYEFDLTGIEFRLEGYAKSKDGKSKGASLYKPELGTIKLQSSIAWICHNSDPEIYSMAESIPEIATVVDYKWERVGSVLFGETAKLEISFLILLVFWSVAIEWYAGSTGLEAQIFLAVWIWLLVTGSIMFTKLVVMHWAIWFQRFVALSQVPQRRASNLRKVVAKFTSFVCAVQRLYVSPPSQIVRDWKELKFRKVSDDLFYAVRDLIYDCCKNTDFNGVRTLCKSTWSLMQYHFGAYPGEWDIGLNMLMSLTMTCAIIFGAIAAATAVFGSSLISLIPLRLARFFVKTTTLICLLESALGLLLQNENFGRFLLTILHILTKDIQSFGYFFTLVVVFAALTLNTLSSLNPFGATDQEGDRGLVWLFAKLIQEAAQDESNSNEMFVRVMTTLFHVTINIIMMNLLIAVMSNTYEEYNVKQNCASGSLLLCICFMFGDLVLINHRINLQLS